MMTGLGITKGLHSLVLWGANFSINLELYAAPQNQTTQTFER